MIEAIPDTGQPWSGGVVSTPVGALAVVFTRDAVVTADFSGTVPPFLFGRPVLPCPLPIWITKLVADALTDTMGHRQWPLLDPGLTPHQWQALSQCTRIPFGTTMAYGEVAWRMGKPGRARAVGKAMSLSPAALFIPTHRVVRSDGTPSACQQAGVAEALRAYERHVLGQRGARGSSR